MNKSASETLGSSPRTPVHSRKVTTDIFAREDGLFDVECRMQDWKHYDLTLIERGLIPAFSPYHNIAVTLVVNDALSIVSATASMDSLPFSQCNAATAPVANLVGVTMGQGWRKAVDKAIRRTEGCTHMREMLYSAATAVIQAVPGYKHQVTGTTWPLPQSAMTTPPRFIGGCASWREDGPVVLRHYPRFYKKA
jgi:hypothetical protein